MWPVGHLDRGFASLPFDKFAVSVLFVGYYITFCRPSQVIVNSTLVMSLVLSYYMPEITRFCYSCYTKI